eukprot:766105-Hanusia_phi.AAC.2
MVRNLQVKLPQVREVIECCVCNACQIIVEEVQTLQELHLAKYRRAQFSEELPGQVEVSAVAEFLPVELLLVICGPDIHKETAVLVLEVQRAVAADSDLLSGRDELKARVLVRASQALALEVFVSGDALAAAERRAPLL